MYDSCCNCGSYLLYSDLTFANNRLYCVNCVDELGVDADDGDDDIEELYSYEETETEEVTEEETEEETEEG